MENLGKIKTLISEEELQKRVKELAKQIYEDYNKQEITFICILKGSVFFTVDLAKNIPSDVKLEFIRVSSYHGTESTGKIELKLDLREDIEGKDIIIIEDIVDTGRTLTYLKKHLKAKKPKSLKICTLLDKKERRVCEIEPEYVGFNIPDKFVLGYGLDVDESYRNLPYIGYIE